MRHVVCVSIAFSMLLTAGTLNAQELKPAATWGAEGAADWAEGGNWTDGAVPGEGEIASIKNGGTAQIATAVGKVDDLAVNSGGVDIGAGGTLDVTGGVVVGSGGSLGLSGGLVKSGSVAVVGTLGLGGGTIETGVAAFDAASTIDLPAGTNLDFGSSIPFLTAGSLSSQQPGFTVGGAAPSLSRGLGLRLTPGGSVDVGSTPIAIVNRTSGNVSITNAAGGSVGVLGLTVTSGNDLLDPANFADTEWIKASATSSDLTELSTTPVALGVGESVDFGNVWGGTAVSPREEDVALSILFDDGTILAGGVEYTGPANDLVLNVDPATGSATLQNMSSSVGDFDVSGYSILSASGSLNVEGFSGIGAEGWTNANPQAVALGELNPTGSMVFSNGTSVDLGSIFTPGGTQDLALEFGIVGGERAQPGTVEYGDVVPPPMTDCNPNTMGDIDSNGVVEFADFLTLSANFGNVVPDHTFGDIDCNGTVEFADFLTLSANFGNTVPASSAASVPEPTSGFLLLIGVLGMLKFRKRGLQIAGILVVAGVMATPSQSFAQEIDSRFIRIHPEGPNNQVNSTTEARGILDGTVLDVIINEDITNTVVTADFGGGPGSYANDENPYGNGVDGTGMTDIIQHVSGTFTIPAGDWTVGFGRDDGGFLRFSNPDVIFIDTFNENGAGKLVDGDGEILFDGTGGHNWTAGTITVPEGGVTTGLESAFFERGGGDSFEVAYIDEHFDPDSGDTLNAFMGGGFELDAGGDNQGFGDWNVTGDPFGGAGDPNDANGDGVVNADDFTAMAENWGNPYGFNDWSSLFQAVNAPAGAATSSVPEPSGVSLLGIGLALILSARRRNRR